MGRRHGPAGWPEDQALQHCGCLRTGVCRARSWAHAQDRMHPIPQGAIDDGLVFARIGYALVHRLAHVDLVVEEFVDVALVNYLTLLAADAFGSKPSHQLSCGPDFGEPLEYHLNRRGL